MLGLLLASGGSGVVWGLPIVLWHLFNFVIFAAIVGYFLNKGLGEYLRTRRSEMAKEMENAARLRAEMEGKFRDYEERLNVIDEQVEKVIAEARQDAETERDRIIAEAQASAQRMATDARALADQEVERARRTLVTETFALATQAAEDALRTQVTKDDQQRLAQEFLAKVEGREQ